MEEVSLLIEGQIFNVQRSALCEHSDYFRAMFSGNYVENQQEVIPMSVVDAESMKIIIQYMNIGIIDLLEYPLSTIRDLAATAIFLQVTELIKQIEYTLDLQIAIHNWLEIMCIAENSFFTKLEKLSAAFGLISFSIMKPAYFTSTIEKLYWYLSHPYLDVKNELDVFNFGLDWISHRETGADALLIVIGCLDVEKLTKTDLDEMKKLLTCYENSLGSKLIECLYDISCKHNIISMDVIVHDKQLICKKFTARIYIEVVKLVRENHSRKFRLIPAVPVWTLKDGKVEVVPHCLYTFKEEKGFEKWLEVADKHLWGWNVVGWGPTKLVVVSGERGRGTGIFSRDVKVYDTLREEWINHGVQLPRHRHGGLGIVNDVLYIVGGVGGFRIVLDRVVSYNLKDRTWRKVAKFPDQIQDPAVCVHNNVLYAAGLKNVYRYEKNGERDRWVMVLNTDIRSSCLVSFKDFIYCTQNYFSILYRFQPSPTTVNDLEYVSYFSNPLTAICNSVNRLIIFTSAICGQSDDIVVEEYTGDEPTGYHKVLWTQNETLLNVNNIAGCCSLVMDMPPLRPVASKYAVQYVKNYCD